MSSASSQPLRLACVMEQVLGHRTHYQNLRHFFGSDPSVDPTWLPIEFEPADVVTRLPIVRGNWSMRASWLAWRRLRAARATRTFDLAFYHTQVTALLSPLHRNLPTVISLDATPLNYDAVGAAYGHAAGGPLEPLKFRANVRAFANARALVTWCAWARDSLVAEYGVPSEKITVLAPGVDLSRWPRGRAATGAGAPARPRLLFVGGDLDRKGGRLLLDVYEQHFADRCDLWLVTQTPLEPRPGVRVFGGLTPNSEQLLRLYAEADIFVFPTLADCAPLAVPEAMAASLPVVASAVGAIPEMVTPDATGHLVPPGDGAALREALAALLAAPETRARMGAAARARVEADYDAQLNARHLVELLKATAATPTARAAQLSTVAQ